MTYRTGSAHHPLADDALLRRRLIVLARRWLADRNDAEDLVQEVWLRTAQGLPDLPAEGREAWLVAVLRHLCIDAWRRQGRYRSALEALGDEAVPQDVPESLADQAQRVGHALHHMVRMLPTDDVLVLLLHEVFGYGHAELGMLVGRSEAALRQQLHRAFQRLRRPARTPKQAPDDAAYLLALCQLALAQRDPAGLVAVLRIATPRAVAVLAQAASAPSASEPGHAPCAQRIHIGNLLAWLAYADEAFACVALAEPSTELLAA